MNIAAPTMRAASAVKESVSEKVENVTRGPSGRTSSSRSFMWFTTGFMMALAFILFVAILADELNIRKTGIEWDAFAGLMTWTRDLVFISVLPFIGNEIATARATQRPDRVNVENVEKVEV